MCACVGQCVGAAASGSSSTCDRGVVAHVCALEELEQRLQGPQRGGLHAHALACGAGQGARASGGGERQAGGMVYFQARQQHRRLRAMPGSARSAWHCPWPCMTHARQPHPSSTLQHAPLLSTDEKMSCMSSMTSAFRASRSSSGPATYSCGGGKGEAGGHSACSLEAPPRHHKRQPQSPGSATPQHTAALACVPATAPSRLCAAILIPLAALISLWWM